MAGIFSGGYQKAKAIKENLREFSHNKPRSERGETTRNPHTMRRLWVSSRYTNMTFILILVLKMTFILKMGSRFIAELRCQLLQLPNSSGFPVRCIFCVCKKAIFVHRELTERRCEGTLHITKIILSS